MSSPQLRPHGDQCEQQCWAHLSVSLSPKLGMVKANSTGVLCVLLTRSMDGSAHTLLQAALLLGVLCALLHTEGETVSQ